MDSLNHDRPPTCKPTPPRRLAFATALVVAAAVTATTAYTREQSESREYLCDNGDRFVVDFRQGHVRLRHGSGIFVLGKEVSASGNRYSDGYQELWTKGNEARLERIGFDLRGACRSVEGSSL